MAASDQLIRKSIPLSNPDFDGIKTSLKSYLKTQAQFTDYDFEGSTLAAVLDLLSYNTHFQAFYLNMVGNEAFLASAVKRDSVVARAAAIGYVPGTTVSASALLYLTMTPSSSTAFIDIPANTIFNASSGELTFTFRTMDTLRVFPNSAGEFIAPEVEVIEGKKFTQTVTISDVILKNGITIPNPNVDGTRLLVEVADFTSSSTFTTYRLSDNITLQDSSSTVFYLSETEGGLLNVKFGDNILSKQPAIGSEVKITYLKSSGAIANGIGAFAIASPIPMTSDTSIQVISAATGGSASESIESIKFNAPKSYEMQNRAVTESDYVAILREKYANQKDVIAWSGSKANPPQYGKTFIAIKPVTGFFITNAEKARVVELLSRYNVLTVRPVVVDPDFIFVDVISDVDYDGKATLNTEGQMIQIVSAAIIAYGENKIGRFDQDLRFSNLTREIDTSEVAVISNRTSLKLSKRHTQAIGVKQDIALSFGNAIVPASLRTSTFTFNNIVDCYIRDDGKGVLQIFRVTGQLNDTLVAPNYGTVNYDTGAFSIPGLEVQALSNEFLDPISNVPYIRIESDPAVDDIVSQATQIVQIDRTFVTVNRLNNYRA